MQRRIDSCVGEHGAQQTAMIQSNPEVLESEALQHFGRGTEQLGLDDQRRRSDGVDIALVKLAEATLLRSVGPPHRLHLIALEKLGQLGAILRDHAREGHRQVVAERQISLTAPAFFTALEDAENQAVALLAVLPHQRVDVLGRWRFERFEPVTLVHAGDDAHHVLAPADVVGKKIAHPTRRVSIHATLET